MFNLHTNSYMILLMATPVFIHVSGLNFYPDIAGPFLSVACVLVYPAYIAGIGKLGGNAR